MTGSLAAKATPAPSKKCDEGVYSLHSTNISEYVSRIKVTCNYISNNMQL